MGQKSLLYQDILNNALKAEFPMRYYNNQCKNIKLTNTERNKLEQDFAYRYSLVVNADYEKKCERKFNKDLNYGLSSICTALSDYFKLKLKRIIDKEDDDNVQ